MRTLYLYLLLLFVASTAFAQKPSPIDPELQKLKANLAAAKHDTTRMMALVDIANYYDRVALQPDSGLVYALKAEQIANHYPNFFKTPNVFNTIGNIYASFLEKTLDATLKKNTWI